MTDTEKTYGRKVVRGAAAKRRQMDAAKKLLFLMIICALIGAIFGSIITGIIVHKQDVKKMNTVELSASESQTFVLNYPFGAGDNRVFTNEMSMDWSSGQELGFVPLDVPMDEDLQEFVYCLSYGYNIDFTLVMAMIEHESSFRPDVVSKTGDYGLMQINECNHEWLTETLGVTDFLDSRQNIRSGLFVLRKLFEEYDNVNQVLMAYNMGESNASKLWEQDIYVTAYTEEITRIQAEYQQQLKTKGEQNNDN